MGENQEPCINCSAPLAGRHGESKLHKTEDCPYVEYKCVVCGNFQAFIRTSNDMHCRKCGARIFVKPRRTSHKELDAV